MSTVSASLETLCINTIRGLSMDGVQRANSGHPGLPLGAAPMAFTLWTRHLRHSPKNPTWFDRDRFILSAGHGSMLLYSLLHLTGYELPIEELQNFRQWGSKTPGHPENHLTPGVEMATGPLGQGVATSVGMAIAERFLATNFGAVDHHTYAICSDGDLMEGISQEAASLAGHLGLGKLIWLYDDNGITIDGSTDKAFTEDVAARFEAYGWHVQKVADGNDVEAIDRAIHAAKADTARPSIICVKTVIGYGSPNKAGSPKAHGAPLGPDEVALTKAALGLPEDQDFYVPTEAAEYFKRAITRGAELEAEWESKLAALPGDKQQELRKLIAGEFGDAFVSALPVFTEKLATRKTGEIVMNAIAGSLPTLMGGSADLAESNLTHLKGFDDQQASTPGGRNINFGIREHAMMAAVNGLNLHGGIRGFGATFLIFSDYCRPSLRLAALMECPSIFVFTHDSIGVGEDGPTHQPIEQVMSLRLIPNLFVLRPADGNETSACWKIAVESTKTPCALMLTRQNLPPLTPANVGDHPAEKGAYVLREAKEGSPNVVLLATGSEVSLAVEAQQILEADGIPTRVVSMPCMELFEQQSAAYRQQVLPLGVPTVSIEAGTTLGWGRYADAHVGLDRFGASAPGGLVMEKLGFNVPNVVSTVKDLLK